MQIAKIFMTIFKWLLIFALATIFIAGFALYHSDQWHSQWKALLILATIFSFLLFFVIRFKKSLDIYKD